MGAAVRDFDWADTPLGPRETWPAWLQATVRNLLECGQPTALWIGAELTTIFNDAFIPILGRRAPTALGKPFIEVWFDVWDDVRPLIERALGGEMVWMENLPLTMTRNGFEEETWWTFSYSPVRDDEGRVMGFLDTVTETTSHVLVQRQVATANADLAREVDKARQAIEQQDRAKSRQRLLQRELTHRMKNTLAMVQAVVAQSMRNATTLAQASQMATERIQALGRAQDILTETNWDVSDIAAVIAAALEPHLDGDDRFVVEGPSADLEAQQSMGLSLAIHELATNATKYGALSNVTGKVFLSWRVEGDQLHLEWRESGGPPVIAPERRGFGSRLTERVVPAYFKGEASLTYPTEGLRYVLHGVLKARLQD